MRERKNEETSEIRESREANTDRSLHMNGPSRMRTEKPRVDDNPEAGGTPADDGAESQDGMDTTSQQTGDGDGPGKIEEANQESQDKSTLFWEWQP